MLTGGEDAVVVRDFLTQHPSALWIASRWSVNWLYRAVPIHQLSSTPTMQTYYAALHRLFPG
jgi:hypothetical protein